jgi:hypothetical protein
VTLHTQQILDYPPVRKQRPGKPLKMLLVGYSPEARTGYLLVEFCKQKRKSLNNGPFEYIKKRGLNYLK